MMHNCVLLVLLLISVFCVFSMRSDNSIIEPKMSASFVPDHKAPMVLFLDRVYGIDNQDFLLHVLEVGFLPDMRAAASLDTVSHNRLHSFNKCSVYSNSVSDRRLSAPQKWLWR